jgi:histidine triad (HIT) family protein
MDKKCVFCSIVAGEIPSDKLYEDDRVLVIHDINPKAKVHLLVLPKRHIDSISSVQDTDEPLLGHMVGVAKKVAKEQGIRGYKLLFNVDKEGGQVVFHIHMHLLSGENIRLSEC